MKKRLLITSIVMMLVVAVALSTATYAWFTQNASVTASSMSLRASVSTGSSLGIGWLGGGEAGTSISANVNAVLGPMAPEALVTGTTTSDVIFRTSTTKEEASQQVFNGGSASYTAFATTAGETDISGKYLLEDGVYKLQASGTAAAGKSYFTKNFAPVVYNNGTVQAFYVKNLSDTNAIASVTVTLDNVPSIGEFMPAVEAKTQNGAKYSTFAEASVSVGDSVATKYILKDNGRYEKATGVAASGTTYYDITTLKAVSGTPGVGEIATNLDTWTDAETPAPIYYVEVKATDMIRVAIFNKAAAVGGNGSETYTLLGVLGTAATTYSAAGAITAFDKNTTYYTSEAVADQVAKGTAFSSGTYYTAANTAVYGSAAQFATNEAVRDLSHYAVATSLTFNTGLAALEQFDIVAIAWLDGTELVDGRASEFGQVSLKFTAA